MSLPSISLPPLHLPPNLSFPSLDPTIDVRLPEDLLRHVYTFLTEGDCARADAVCRRFRSSLADIATNARNQIIYAQIEGRYREDIVRLFAECGYRIGDLAEIVLNRESACSDYVNRLTPTDLRHPIMRFSSWGRPGIAFALTYRFNGMDRNTVLTLHQRRIGDPSYVFAENGHAVPALHSSHLPADARYVEHQCYVCPENKGVAQPECLRSVLNGTNTRVSLSTQEEFDRREIARAQIEGRYREDIVRLFFECGYRIGDLAEIVLNRESACYNYIDSLKPADLHYPIMRFRALGRPGIAFFVIITRGNNQYGAVLTLHKRSLDNDSHYTFAESVGTYPLEALKAAHMALSEIEESPTLHRCYNCPQPRPGIANPESLRSVLMGTNRNVRLATQEECDRARGLFDRRF